MQLVSSLSLPSTGVEMQVCYLPTSPPFFAQDNGGFSPSLGRERGRVQRIFDRIEQGLQRCLGIPPTNFRYQVQMKSDGDKEASRDYFVHRVSKKKIFPSSSCCAYQGAKEEDLEGVDQLCSISNFKKKYLQKKLSRYKPLRGSIYLQRVFHRRVQHYAQLCLDMEKVKKNHPLSPYIAARLIDGHARLACALVLQKHFQALIKDMEECQKVLCTSINPVQGCCNHCIVYVNGINTPYDRALKTARFISESFGQVEVNLIYNPSNTFPKIVCNIFLTLMNKFFVGPLKEKSSTFAILNPSSVVLHYFLKEKIAQGKYVLLMGHSEGTMNIESVLRMVPENLRKQYCSIIAIGTPFILDETLGYRVDNWINEKDCVRRLGRFAEFIFPDHRYAKGNVTFSENVYFLSSNANEDLLNHAIDGSEYRKVIESIGKDYNKYWGVNATHFEKEL